MAVTHPGCTGHRTKGSLRPFRDFEGSAQHVGRLPQVPHALRRRQLDLRPGHLAPVGRPLRRARQRGVGLRPAAHVERERLATAQDLVDGRAVQEKEAALLNSLIDI